MSAVRVVTDSSSCLPPELIQEYGIAVAPVNMTIDGKNYRDEIDITLDQFLAMMPRLTKLPTASGVGPGDFIPIFTQLAGETKEIVCIGMSRAFSVTCPSAEKARDAVVNTIPGLKIEIVDSKASAGALSFIVLEAARAAKAGKSLAEVVAVALDMVPRVKHFTGMHSLRYLTHIGRLPHSLVAAGAPREDGLIQVKTVISIDRKTGQIEFVGKYRGRRKSMEAMIAGAKNCFAPDKEAHFIVHYSDNIEDAAELEQMVRANFKCAELHIARCTAVVTCSTGPQYGIGFFV